MGRKEFYEKLEELDLIRKNVLFDSQRRKHIPPNRTQVLKVEKENEHSKLLLQSSK